ncbi:peptide deformylase [Variovorax sp. PCZ-1]|uniref:peptide deformylase n=1 Tax=Variovorax sp. PCZ-1 TaxID=2835533 RepID=UPI001BCDA6E9|nr:peptide deformylase [Variovorax sp. PCZ-1]
MAIREILKMGDPRLLRVAQPVREFNTPELHALLQDMQDTMAAANGAGLAAPQIGVDLQLVIFGSGQINPRYPDAPPVPRTVLINPVITPFSIGKSPITGLESARDAIESIAFDLNYQADAKDMEDGWEGCLSVPGLRGAVPRFAKIRYQGFNELGETIDRTVDGFHARVVQHECDHLHGILYPMRVKDFSRFGFTEILFPEINAAEDD